MTAMIPVPLDEVIALAILLTAEAAWMRIHADTTAKISRFVR